MYRDDLRKTITARFHQSLSESNVEITAIPQNQLQAIVNALADGIIDGLGELENEANPTPGRPRPSGNPADDEELLWTGKPYLSLGIRYELTSQRLRIIRGLLGRSVEEIELVRVRDTAVTQHMGERTLNVGDVKIVSNDANTPTLMLHNVRDPMHVRELIRKAVMAEKERRGLHYREEM